MKSFLKSLFGNVKPEKTAGDMSPVEAAILASLKSSPNLWRFTETGHGLAGMNREKGVSLVSERGCVAFNGTSFGPAFSRAWSVEAQRLHSERVSLEINTLQTSNLERLKKAFDVKP